MENPDIHYIDTHTHIYEKEFERDFDDAVERAIVAGVKTMIMPDIDMKSRPSMQKAAEAYPDIMHMTCGLHPTSVNPDYKTELKEVEKALAKGKIIGIGEIGLDFYWDTAYTKEQIKAFEYQLSMAAESSLPVIVHSRNSMPEVFDSLKKFPYVKGVLHCFPGTLADAARAIDMGYLLGIGGVVTFKNSMTGRVVKEMGYENILLETDSPYLAPVPHRGKRNEPAFIPLIAEKIAELTATDLKLIAEKTRLNAINLFSL